MSRHHPGIYTAGRWGAWAYCACGWIGPTVHHGAIGASVSWALHMARTIRSHQPDPYDAPTAR